MHEAKGCRSWQGFRYDQQTRRPRSSPKSQGWLQRDGGSMSRHLLWGVVARWNDMNVEAIGERGS